MPRLAALVACAFLSGACSLVKDEPASNVQPPAPGVPATPAEVTGIYRTIHQGVLQLRADGAFVLIVPEGPGPSSGTFTLANGRLVVRSDDCGGETGDYDLLVTGEQEAGKSALNFSAVRDPCDDRRRYLTIDPWIYANS